jgi:hypothetical protein
MLTSAYHRIMQSPKTAKYFHPPREPLRQPKRHQRRAGRAKAVTG